MTGLTKRTIFTLGPQSTQRGWASQSYSACVLNCPQSTTSESSLKTKNTVDG